MKDHQMVEKTKTPFIKKLGSLFGGSGKAKRSEYVEIAVCRLLDEKINIIHLKRKNSSVIARNVLTSKPLEVSAFLRKCGKKCLVVALLPRSDYLIKVLEIPHVMPSEVEAMLNLEVEASLPSEFGEVDVSYRNVPAKKEGYRRYEVYISRCILLEDYVKRLNTFGCPLDMIIPSAIAWNDILTGANQFSMLVVNLKSTSQLEIALAGDDKCLSVRAMKNPQSPSGSLTYERGLTECIRSLLNQTAPESYPLTVGWIGEDCPLHLYRDVVTFEETKSEATVLSNEGDKDGIEDPPLQAAGCALLNNRSADLFKTCDLMPGSIMSTRIRRAINKNVGIAVGGIVIGMLLSYASLKVAIYRHENILEGINEKISLIEMEGEGIGQRIEQLETIRAIRATRNDLTDILVGLYAATPGGASYSNVELGESGRLRLRGQAESLALPFLLPQELEKQPMFKEVVLRDAGQVKKSGGTVTEFRIECSLKRRDNR